MGAFGRHFSSQGRQDRPKIATRAAQEPPRSSPETPRAAQDRPKNPPKTPKGCRRQIWLLFGSLLLPFGSRFGFILLLFGCFLTLFRSTFQQHAYSIPTTFPQHSYSILLYLIRLSRLLAAFRPAIQSQAPFRGGGGKSPAGRPQ